LAWRDQGAVCARYGEIIGAAHLDRDMTRRARTRWQRLRAARRAPPAASRWAAARTSQR